jgi:O-Antigen ligase
MPQLLKELIVILAIAAVTFRLAKPLAVRFMLEEDFSRRRNVWFVLTVAAFASPSFWLFAPIAAVTLAWAGRKDSNPIALYLMLLHVVPPVPVEIPVVGITSLFELDIYRLLSFFVLIPAIWRLRARQDPDRIHGFQMMDYLLLGYGLLQIVLYVPADLPNHAITPDSFTNVLRRALLFFVDSYVLYFAISRTCSNARTIIEAQAAYCIACAVMSLIAGFEAVRQWVLYADLTMLWNPLTPAWTLYTMRADSIRVFASAGMPLALGYLLAIAFGFWLHLQRHFESKVARLCVALLFWVGLVAAYSRGPWIGAVLIYFVFAALGPRARSRFFKATFAALLAAAVISVTPLGERIAKVFPFLGGSVDDFNVTYRQRLATRSWELIQGHPFFGDQMALQKMGDLRQGQGIIDLVNSYAGVALCYGIVGLTLFCGFILAGLLKAYRYSSATKFTDPEFSLLGASLAACIIGTLAMIENCSFILGYEKMFYVLAAFATAYAHAGISAARAANGARATRRKKHS